MSLTDMVSTAMQNRFARIAFKLLMVPLVYFSIDMVTPKFANSQSNAQVEIKLKDENNNPIIGNVKFRYINGSKKGEIATDQNGVALLNLATAVYDRTNNIPNNYNLIAAPNPANNYTVFYVNSNKFSKAELYIFNLLGQQLAHENYNLSIGENMLRFNIPQDWADGIKFAVIKYGNKVEKTKFTHFDDQIGFSAPSVSMPSMSFEKPTASDDIEFTYESDEKQAERDTVTINQDTTIVKTMVPAYKIVLNMQLYDALVKGYPHGSVPLFDRDGNQIATTQENGFANVNISAPIDTIVIDDNTTLHQTKLPFEGMELGKIYDLGKIPVVHISYPMDKLRGFQGYGDFEQWKDLSFWITKFDKSVLEPVFEQAVNDTVYYLTKFKYVNVPKQDKEKWRGEVQNINYYAGIANSIYRIPLPDEDNMIYRTVNSKEDEIALRDSLKVDPNTNFFWLNRFYITMPNTNSNDRSDLSEGSHYATKGKIITNYFNTSRYRFSEAMVFLCRMHGETDDPAYDWTIFDGAGSTDHFQTYINYLGRPYFAETLMITQQEAYKAGTELKPNNNVVFPTTQFSKQ